MSRCLHLVALLGCADAFRPVLAAGPRSASLLLQQRARSSPPVAVVVDISSTEEFEKALDEAGPALVVVDYSTSWCGPCKIIAPKFDEFSEQYKSVTFLKVCMTLATQLVKRELRPRRTRRLPTGCCVPFGSCAGDGRQQPGR